MANQTAKPPETSATSPPTSGPPKDWKAKAKKLLENPNARTFKDLYLDESDQLGPRLAPESITVLKGVADEPWVAFTPQDRFGLALSGGGIRSATFNLGVLQALADLGILKAVDYLSTVSGGGYVGGFWTAWLTRKGDDAGSARFPLGNDSRGGERAEVRHLREFSRFLLPRVGLLQTEFWGIVMTVLGGLVPSFIAALAMLFLYWIIWVAITGMLLWDRPNGTFALGGALVAYLLISESLWATSGKSEKNRHARVGYVLGSLSGAALVVAGSHWRGEIETALHFTLTGPSERFLRRPSCLQPARRSFFSRGWCWRVSSTVGNGSPAWRALSARSLASWARRFLSPLSVCCGGCRVNYTEAFACPPRPPVRSVLRRCLRGRRSGSCRPWKKRMARMCCAPR